MRESFLDYMYGQSVKGRGYTIRQKLFSHRFVLLEMLLKAEKISFLSYEKYLAIAQEMKGVIPYKRVLSDSYNARWLRAKYNSDIENEREKRRERHRKYKQKEKAE